MKFRSKPVEIEAFQLTREYVRQCLKDMVTPRYMSLIHHSVGGDPLRDPDEMTCVSKQGRVHAKFDDWIIAEPGGSGCYPCAPDVFALKYEPIS